MELYRCDACKRDTRKYGLNTLIKELQTDNVIQLCDECNKEVDNCWQAFQIYLTDKVKIPFCKRIIQRLTK